MTIKEELIEYAKNCLEDKYISEYEDYISCKKHKWACQRLLNDFQNENLNVLSKPFNYYWNEYHEDYELDYDPKTEMFKEIKLPPRSVKEIFISRLNYWKNENKI